MSAGTYALTAPDDGFERWRSEYPESRRSVKAGRAKAVWAKLNPSPDLQELMLEKLRIHARSKQWADPRFVPHMSSWINGEYWKQSLAGYVDPDYCPNCGHHRRAHAPCCGEPGCACGH